MRYVTLTIFCTALAACNMPSIELRGFDSATVTVEGSTFDARVKGTVAEAIRTNLQYAPGMGQMGGGGHLLRLNKSAGAK